MSRPPGRGRFRGGRSGPQQQRMYEELRAPRPLTLYMRGFMGPRVVNIWNEPHEGVPFRPVVSAVPLASPPVVVDSTASGFCPDATIETNMQNLNLAQRNVPALLEMAAGESGAGFGEGQNIVGTTNGSGDLEPLSSSISNTMAEQINGSMSAESDAIFLPIPVILKSAAEKPLESNLVTEDSSAAGQTDGNNAQECQFFELFPTSEETEHAAGLAAASASIAAGSGYLTTARPDAALEFSAAATSNVAVNVATGTDVGTQSLAAVANTEVVSASGGFEAAPTSFEAGSAVGQYHSASNNAPRHPYYMHYSTTVGPAASAGFAMAIRAAAATGSMEAVRAAMVASAAAAAGTTAVVGPTVAAVDAAVAAESVESGRATAPSGFGATAPLGGAGFGPVAAVGNSAEFGSGTGPGAAEAPLPAGTVFVRRAAAAGGSAAFSHAALASGPIAYGSASAAAAYPATFNSDAAAGDPATFNPGALTAAAPDPAAFRDLPVIFNYTTYSRAGAVCQLGIRAAAPYVPATAPRAPGAFVPPRASVNGPSAGVFVRGAVPPYVGMPVRVGAGPPRPDSIYDEPCLIPCRPHDDSRCRVHRSTTNEGEYVNFPPGTLMILYGAGGEPYYADATVLNCDTTRSCNCSTRAECTHIERDDDGSPDEPCDYEALQELLRQINERGGLGDGRGGPGNGRGGPGDGRGGPGDGRGGPGDGRGGGAAGSGGAATGQGGAEDGRGGGATGHGGAGDGRGGGAAGHGGAGDGRGGGAAERGGAVDGRGGGAAERGGAVDGRGVAAGGRGGAAIGYGGVGDGRGGGAAGRGGAAIGRGGGAAGRGGAAAGRGGGAGGRGGAAAARGGAAAGRGGAAAGRGGAAAGRGGAAAGRGGAQGDGDLAFGHVAGAAFGHGPAAGGGDAAFGHVAAGAFGQEAAAFERGAAAGGSDAAFGHVAGFGRGAGVFVRGAASGADDAAFRHVPAASFGRGAAAFECGAAAGGANAAFGHIPAVAFERGAAAFELGAVGGGDAAFGHVVAAFGRRVAAFDRGAAVGGADAAFGHVSAAFERGAPAFEFGAAAGGMDAAIGNAAAAFGRGAALGGGEAEFGPGAAAAGAAAEDDAAAEVAAAAAARAAYAAAVARAREEGWRWPMAVVRARDPPAFGRFIGPRRLRASYFTQDWKHSYPEKELQKKYCLYEYRGQVRQGGEYPTCPPVIIMHNKSGKGFVFEMRIADIPIGIRDPRVIVKRIPIRLLQENGLIEYSSLAYYFVCDVTELEYLAPELCYEPPRDPLVRLQSEARPMHWRIHRLLGLDSRYTKKPAEFEFLLMNMEAEFEEYEYHPFNGFIGGMGVDEDSGYYETDDEEYY